MTVEYMKRITWFVCGLLCLALLGLSINVILTAKSVVDDAKRVSSQMQISDMRQVLTILENEQKIKLGSIEIELQRQHLPLEATPENWQGFLVFCARTGYVVSDKVWQLYRYGKLQPY